MTKSPMVAGPRCHLSLSKNVTVITFFSCNLNLQQDYLFHSIFIWSFPPSQSLLPLSHMASITKEVERVSPIHPYVQEWLS